MTLKVYAKLVDKYGTIVTVQQSSAVKSRVWIFGTPNKKLDNEINFPPHLSRKQARVIANALLKFANEED